MFALPLLVRNRQVGGPGKKDLGFDFTDVDLGSVAIIGPAFSFRQQIQQNLPVP